ncbi:MAG: type I restriction-modification system subunit M N-terminal domain-containing protein [Candidatus Nanopelagicales bacterium]
MSTVETGVRKELQRAELHKTIWRIANDLRGSVDGWDFKSYVLGLLFYRFISENLTCLPQHGGARCRRRGLRLRATVRRRG